jgi:hypothetical protein
MRLLLTLTAAAVLVGFTTADEPKKDEKMKKHELKVTFATPTPGYTAKISEVRVVGKELWAKVDVTAPDGIVAQVISKTTTEATVEGPDLPVKYVVFGKTWKWENKEKDITFADDLSKDDKEKWEKAWKDGKVVFEAKKK